MFKREDSPHGRPTSQGSAPGQDGPDFLVEVFFENLYRPLRLRHRTAEYAAIFRTSIIWMKRSLQRPPRLSDLNHGAISRLLQMLAEAGLGQTRLREIRQRLLALWKVAAEMELAGSYDPPPLPPPAFEAIQRPWAALTPPAGTLLAFYRETFRPALAEMTQQNRSRYDSAVTSFHDFTQRLTRLADITPELLQEFFKWLTLANENRLSEQHLTSLRRILHSEDPVRFPKKTAGGRRPRQLIARESSRHGRVAVTELVGGPGTIVAYYQTVYAPQALAESCVLHRLSHLALLRKLRACFGRHLHLEELSKEKVSAFVAWLHGQGSKAGTVRNHRTRLLTLWRYAHDDGQAPPVPTFKRLRVAREQPDAWSLEEVSRIIDATARLTTPPFDGIPAAKWWRAILLTCWYTALRRGSLLKIRTVDVDLEERWLYVPSSHMKNGRGKRFRLGADAVAAVREIINPQRQLLFPVVANRRLHLEFREILRLANVSAASRLPCGQFHKMRRTVATQTAVSVGLAAASALLGHSGPEMTQRYIDPSYTPGQDASEYLPPLASGFFEEGGDRG